MAHAIKCDRCGEFSSLGFEGLTKFVYVEGLPGKVRVDISVKVVSLTSLPTPPDLCEPCNKAVLADAGIMIQAPKPATAASD